MGRRSRRRSGPCPATCWSTWTSTRTRGSSSRARPASPASSVPPTSPSRSPSPRSIGCCTARSRRRSPPRPSSPLASPSRGSRARWPTSPGRSRRSTRTPRSSRSWYPSSGARRPSRSDSTRSRRSRRLTHGKEGPHPDQAPGRRRPGVSGAARRPCAGPARHQHHGVLQGVQRPDPAGLRHRHPGRDHGLRGPLVHVRDQDAARRGAHQAGHRPREGLRRAAPQQGRQDQQGPGPRDRREEAAGPERERSRSGQQDHRRHCPQHGRGGRLVMAQHGKTYVETKSQVDREHEYLPAEAIKLVKELKRAKFDESVEVHVRTGLNVRHADEQLRGTIALPNGLGKDVKIAVFARGPKADEATAAGADVVGAEDLAKQIEEGFTDFDVAIATPDMMPVVGRLGRILGPQGKMPNPKVGTVTMDVAKAVEESKAGKVEYRTDRTAIVHLNIGKTSFGERALLENYAAVIEELIRAKPSAAKGRYLHSVTVASTMGAGNRVGPSRTPGILGLESADTAASA